MLPEKKDSVQEGIVRLAWAEDTDKVSLASKDVRIEQRSENLFYREATQKRESKCGDLNGDLDWG